MAHGSSPSPPAPGRPQRIDAFLREAEAFLATRGLHESGRNGMALPALAYQFGLTRQEYDEAMELLYARTSAPPAPPLPPEPALPPEPILPPDPTAALPPSREEPLVPSEVVGETPSENLFPEVRPQDLFSFVYQARLVLADERGWSERTLARLNVLADHLLIPPTVRPELYRRLDDPTFAPPPLPDNAASDAADVDDDEVITAEVAEAQPLQERRHKRRRTPAELYAKYLRVAFKALPGQRINPRREQKLIQEGTTKLGLSEVLARDVLLEVAQQQGFAVVSQSERPEESDDHDALEERLTTFQQRAATIIAGQGGVTSIARLMITETAADLGLSDAQRDAALASIQRQSEKTEAETRLNQRAETYRQFIHEKLQALDHGIVVASLADKLVQLGIDLHGLSDELAWSTLREVVHEEELRLVSLEQAKAHIGHLADEMLEEDRFLSITGRQRLLTEGEQWGLGPAACQQLIEDRAVAFGQRRTRGRRQVALIFGAFFALLIFGGGYALYLGSIPPVDRPMAQNPSSGTPTAPEDPASAASSQEKVSAEIRWRRQPWWSEALALNLLELYQSEPALQDQLTAICTEDPQARAAAYRGLMPRLATTAVARTGSHREEVREVVVGLAFDDPSDEAVEAIAQTLTTGVSLSNTQVNASTPFSQLLEKAYLSVAAARQPNLPEPRQAMFLDRLSQQLGVSFTGSAEPLELTINEMIREQYRKLRELSAGNPNLAAELHAALSQSALGYLPPDQVIAKDGPLAAELLGRLTENWPAYEKVVQRVVQSQQADRLLPLLDTFERPFASGIIQRELALLFSRRIGRSVDPDDPQQGAALVRTELGLDSVIVRDGEMYRLFARSAAPFAWEVPPDAGPDQLAAEIIALSYVNVLGHAAAQGNLGQRTFQELASQGPPQLSLDGGSAVPSGPDPRVVAELQSLITRLHRASDPIARVNVYRELTRLAGDVRDLDDTSSARLVEYILAPKPRTEQKQIVNGLRAFAHWTRIKLAMADQLDNARRATDDLQEIVGGVVGETIVLNDASAARDQLRETLLRHALEGLDTQQPIPGALSPAMANETALHLLNHYQRHAALLGISAEQTASLTLPDALAKRLVDEERARLEALSLATAEQARLLEITHREIALQSLSTTPLAAMAVRQRTWFDLLRLRIAHEQPQLAGQLDRLAQELERHNAQAPTLIHQLRSGELALVKLWELAGGSA